MVVKRDRPLRVLELLATAGADGLLTTEVVEQAGEIAEQRTLTWFGNILRDGERHGWTERAGKTKGGYQSPAIQRWVITAAGRQHILEVKERRSARTKAERKAAAAIHRRQRAVKQARRAYPGREAATREEREQVTILLRDAGVSWRDIGSVTGFTYQTARNDYKAGKRQWPGAIAPRGRTYPFTPKSARFGVISEVLAEETGLETWQTAGMLKVMHSLGFTIGIPPGFRFHAEEEAAAEATREEKVTGEN